MQANSASISTKGTRPHAAPPRLRTKPTNPASETTSTTKARRGHTKGSKRGRRDPSRENPRRESRGRVTLLDRPRARAKGEDQLEVRTSEGGKGGPAVLRPRGVETHTAPPLSKKSGEEAVRSGMGAGRGEGGDRERGRTEGKAEDEVRGRETGEKHRGGNIPRGGGTGK